MRDIHYALIFDKSYNRKDEKAVLSFFEEVSRLATSMNVNMIKADTVTESTDIAFFFCKNALDICDNRQFSDYCKLTAKERGFFTVFCTEPTTEALPFLPLLCKNTQDIRFLSVIVLKAIRYFDVFLFTDTKKCFLSNIFVADINSLTLMNLCPVAKSTLLTYNELEAMRREYYDDNFKIAHLSQCLTDEHYNYLADNCHRYRENSEKIFNDFVGYAEQIVRIAVFYSCPSDAFGDFYRDIFSMPLDSYVYRHFIKSSETYKNELANDKEKSLFYLIGIKALKLSRHCDPELSDSLYNSYFEHGQDFFALPDYADYLLSKSGCKSNIDKIMSRTLNMMRIPEQVFSPCDKIHILAMLSTFEKLKLRFDLVCDPQKSNDNNLQSLTANIPVHGPLLNSGYMILCENNAFISTNNYKKLLSLMFQTDENMLYFTTAQTLGCIYPYVFVKHRLDTPYDNYMFAGYEIENELDEGEQIYDDYTSYSRKYAEYLAPYIKNVALSYLVAYDEACANALDIVITKKDKYRFFHKVAERLCKKLAKKNPDKYIKDLIFYLKFYSSSFADAKQGFLLAQKLNEKKRIALSDYLRLNYVYACKLIKSDNREAVSIFRIIISVSHENYVKNKTLPDSYAYLNSISKIAEYGKADLQDKTTAFEALINVKYDMPYELSSDEAPLFIKAAEYFLSKGEKEKAARAVAYAAKCIKELDYYNAERLSIDRSDTSEIKAFVKKGNETLDVYRKLAAVSNQCGIKALYDELNANISQFETALSNLSNTD